MWKVRKFSLQSGLELMTTRMIDEHTNCMNHRGCGIQNWRNLKMGPKSVIDFCRLKAFMVGGFRIKN